MRVCLQNLWFFAVFLTTAAVCIQKDTGNIQSFILLSYPESCSLDMGLNFRSGVSGAA